jgi:cell division protein ZapB
MADTKHLDQITERVERLLLRHEELQRTNQLLHEQVQALQAERDSLKSRLNAARARIDALLDRLPPMAARIRHPRRHPQPGARMTKPASKQIEVQIMGQSYLLACPAGGESRCSTPWSAWTPPCAASATPAR